MRSVRALERADSVSIDPHKLGYVPYPAGAFLLKDRRGRELVATDPPYLAVAGSRENGEQPVNRPIHLRRVQAWRISRRSVAESQDDPAEH